MDESWVGAVEPIHAHGSILGALSDTASFPGSLQWWYLCHLQSAEERDLLLALQQRLHVTSTQKLRYDEERPGLCASAHE